MDFTSAHLEELLYMTMSFFDDDDDEDLDDEEEDLDEEYVYVFVLVDVFVVLGALLTALPVVTTLLVVFLAVEVKFRNDVVEDDF